MSMRKILFTLAFAGLCAAGAQAQDVYVYQNGNPDAIGSMKNLQRISFLESGISLVPKTGDAKEFNTKDVDYMLFYEKGTQVGIRPAASAGGINIAYDGAAVSVEASEPISSIDIYAADGVRVSSAAPKAKSAKLSTASLAKGVYIVKATAGKATATSEIIKK